MRKADADPGEDEDKADTQSGNEERREARAPRQDLIELGFVHEFFFPSYEFAVRRWVCEKVFEKRSKKFP